jgi:hypothetical protein
VAASREREERERESGEQSLAGCRPDYYLQARISYTRVAYTGLPHPGPFTGFTRAAAFYQPPAKCQMVFFTRDLLFTFYQAPSIYQGSESLRAAAAG